MQSQNAQVWAMFFFGGEHNDPDSQYVLPMDARDVLLISFYSL